MHPELGEGQHLVLTRSLADRAPITDAAGAPLFTPTEVVNVGVDKAQVTDLPALAAALSAATGIAAEEIVADVEAAPEGQFVPVITLRRPDFEKIRAAGLRPARRGVPDRRRGCWRPTARFAVALLGRVGAATAEVIEESQDDGSPRYAAGDQLGFSGLQRAFQEQLAGTAGFTVSVVSTDEGTGDQGQEIAVGRAGARHPLQTPIVAADAERGRRRGGRSDPAHAPGRRPARAPARSSPSRRTRPPTPATRSAGQLPARVEHEDHHRHRPAVGRALSPDSPVPCPGTTVVDGREFENQDQFDLGTVSFRQAFAESCNTTFIQQALELPDPALADAAAGYGVGADWQLPVGIFSGSVPARQHRARRRPPTPSGRARC